MWWTCLEENVDARNYSVYFSSCSLLARNWPCLWVRRFLVLKCMEELQYKYLVIWVNNFALIFAVSNKWVKPHGKAAKMEMSPCRRVHGTRVCSWQSNWRGVFKLYSASWNSMQLLKPLVWQAGGGALGPELLVNLKTIANFLLGHFIAAAKGISMDL